MSSILGANGRHKIILADCPWEYDNYGMAKHGSAKEHYDEQTVEDICAVNASRWADPDGCMLFFWATGPKERDGTVDKVIEAWDFRGITKAFTWVKVNQACKACGQPWDLHEPPKVLDDLPGRAFGCAGFVATSYKGTGNYTMGGTEDCWLARRGKTPFASRRVRMDVPHTVFYPVTSHSRKPDVVQARIEMLWPWAAPRLELYATRRRARWRCWGHALGHEINQDGVGPRTAADVEAAARKDDDGQGQAKTEE